MFVPVTTLGLLVLTQKVITVINYIVVTKMCVLLYLDFLPLSVGFFLNRLTAMRAFSTTIVPLLPQDNWSTVSVTGWQDFHCFTSTTVCVTTEMSCCS